MPTDDPGWSDYIELPDLPDAGAPPAAAAAAPPVTEAPVTAPTAPPAPSAAAAPAAITPSGLATRKPPWLFIAIGVLVIAAVVGGAIAVSGGGKSTTKNGALTSAQWETRANAICRKYSSTLTQAAIRGDADTYAAEGQKEIAEFNALGLPPTNADTAKTMLTYLDEAINDVNNQDFQSADAASKSAVAQATALHLTDCASG